MPSFVLSVEISWVKISREELRKMLKTKYRIVLILLFCLIVSLPAQLRAAEEPNTEPQTDLEKDLAKAAKRKAEGNPLLSYDLKIDKFKVTDWYIDKESSEEKNILVIESEAKYDAFWYAYYSTLYYPLAWVYKDGQAVGELSVVNSTSKIIEESDNGNYYESIVKKFMYKEEFPKGYKTV